MQYLVWIFECLFVPVISLSGLATLAPSAADLLRSGKRVTGLMGRSIARPAMQGLFKTHCYARSFNPINAGGGQIYPPFFFENSYWQNRLTEHFLFCVNL